MGSRDRLSRLPKDLRRHILSFLPIEDVIRTSFLSKRWRKLWMSVPSIDFGCQPYEKSDDTIVAFMDNLVLNHKAKKVQKFCIQFCYCDIYAANVDAWIHTMLRRNVEELYLDFYGDGRLEYSSEKALYKLPRSFFKSRSLITLNLRFCDLNLPSSVCLRSLKTLCLCMFELTSDMIKNLISGCPLLEDLMLKECNKNSDLIILDAHPHLKRLKIHDEYVGSGYEINIHAPSLLMLEFAGCLKRSNYNCIKTLKSLESAKFECEEDDWCPDTNHENYCFLYPKLLGYLHVKDLKLDSWFIQALSIIQVQDFTGPPIVATHLELTTGLKKWELPGLAYLHINSSNLETLTLNVEESIEIDLQGSFREEYDFDEQNYWKVGSIPLQHLKMIRVNNFMGGYSHSRILSEETILSDTIKQLKFMKFLLRNSMILERMIIKISREPKIRELADKEALFFKVTKKLLAFPRASSIAIVLISY